MQSLGTFSATDRTDDPIMMIGVHGNFWGVVAPAARMEGLLAAHVIKPSLGKGIAAAYGTKWWDYRRMAPGHCFGLFIDRYYQGFRNAARTFLTHTKRSLGHADARKAAAIVGVGQIQYKPQDIFERDRGHITGMWKAMEVSDTFGLPYDHFCRLVFQTAIDRKWSRLPHPRQLYSPNLAAAALDSWDELMKNRLITAVHPMYDLANYAGLPVQDEYRAWLVERLKERKDPALSIYAVCYQKQQLPLSMVAPIFPDATMKRAQLLAA